MISVQSPWSPKSLFRDRASPLVLFRAKEGIARHQSETVCLRRQQRSSSLSTMGKLKLVEWVPDSFYESHDIFSSFLKPPDHTSIVQSKNGHLCKQQQVLLLKVSRRVKACIKESISHQSCLQHGSELSCQARSFHLVLWIPMLYLGQKQQPSSRECFKLQSRSFSHCTTQQAPHWSLQGESNLQLSFLFHQVAA